MTPLTDAFVVNTFTPSDQFDSDVIATGPDEFVIVWTSLGQDGGSGGLAGVFGQRWTGGTRIGDEIHINTFTTDSQYEARVAGDGADHVAVSWISFAQDGDAHGVFARRYDAGMLPEGLEFQVNTYTVGAQNHPDLSVGPDGSLVVAWESSRPDSDGLEIFAQRYAPNGTPLGEEFQVNTVTAKPQRYPHVAHDGDGNFLIVWTGGSTFDAMDDPDGSGAGVFARAYDATGTARGPDFVVPTHTMYAQFSPAVAGRPDGGFHVAWGGNGISGSGPTSGGVFLMPVSVDGVRLHEDDTFLGFSASESEGWVSASVLGNGLGVIVWDKRDVFGLPARIVGRLVAAGGYTVGEEVTLAESESSSLQGVHVASYGATDFIITWTDTGGTSIDGSGSAVAARVFRASPECGDASSDGRLSAVDALSALKSATGTDECPACVCDVDVSQGVTATDALLLLRSAVGLHAALECAECL